MARPAAKKSYARRKPVNRRKPAYKKKAAKKTARVPRSTLGESFGNMVRNPGNGACSTSSFSHSKPASKRVKTMSTIGASNIGFQNRAFAVKCLSGTQASNVGDILPVAQLRSIATRVPDGSVTGLAPWRFVVQETLDTFTMSNGTNGTLEVDIYDVFPKRNIPVSQTYVPPGQTGTLSNSYDLDETCLSYWKQGARLSAQELANTVLSVELADQYNASPKDSLLFNTYFRVSQRTRIYLPQGCSHKHTVTRHINQIVNTAECITGDGALSDLAKCTSHVMIVIRGEPLDGIFPDLNKVITTSEGLLQVIQTARFKWTWCADQAQSNYYSNILQNVTVQKNINPATGLGGFVESLVATAP